MSLPGYAMNKTSFPDMYEKELVGPLFRPFAELTLRELAVAPGQSVLDIACGTGAVSRLARELVGPSGKVVGVDLNPGMLAVARRVAPEIEFREGTALDLPLQQGEQFDIVTCQQGLQFFPDKPAAARQMLRALKEGGRLAVSVWVPLDESPVFRELHQVAESKHGPLVDDRFSFADAGALRALLQEAGFRDVDVRTVTRTIHLDSAEVFLRLNTMAIIGMNFAGRDLAEEERASLLEDLIAAGAPALEPYRDGSGLTFQLPANLATAAR